MWKIAALLAGLGFMSACGINAPSRAVTEFKGYEPQAMECLAEAIYFEAGNKGEAGRRAVAHTILNRKDDPRWPNTVCGVISEGQPEGRCQFSYRCGLDYTRYVYPDQLEMAQTTAKAVLTGEAEDPTEGALFFHATFVNPSWFRTRERIGDFGGNIFYY